MKKLFCVALVLVLAAGFCFARGNTQSSGLTFTVALDSDIDAVDPGRAWDYTTNQVTNQITEGLVTFDNNGNIITELARSWSQLDDLTYVYNVRDDITFSDGTRMTMDDVLFSFQRTADPNGGTYFAGKFADVESFSVNGWQFIIKLKQPSAVFKYIPATGAGRIISKDYYQRHASNFGTAAGGIVGTGPFVYESWINGQEIVLKKNLNYWDKVKLTANIIDTLVFKVIPNDTTRAVALQTGEVDFTVNVPVDMIDVLSVNPLLNHVSADSFHLTYLALNTQRAPMNDVNVRRAISQAINLADFHRNIIRNAGSVGTSLPFSPALYGDNAANWRSFLSTKNYVYDLSAARASLARSAYPNGFNCNIVVSENNLANQRALFVQEALRPLNINVAIRRMSGGEQDEHQFGNARDANGFRDYDMIIGGWETDYPDINGNIDDMYSSVYAGENGWNAAAYVNPVIDGLIEAQRRTLDPVARFDIQSRLIDIVVNDVAYIVFDYTKRHSIINRKYTGVNISPAWLWVLPFQNVRHN